ncbi:MAG TPA: flagellin [Nitrospira sp.]|jgi:flagellin|uniref:Flagellin n=1 Tax=Nitrospira defluvii TaxID=330214 RepID=D8PFL5_9BACT|nr:flagellin FliC [Nitrospira sp.]OYT24020.1 MAG: flagellin FliC [Nitrospira sp. UW-LDO-02]CBK42052.1 Flagellin, class B [Nitrospira defluvii]MBK7487578.1 flagellin FliC [Nitrospira sp.]MBK8379757.1 flagellin FliC [Nitrospira sp.]
MALVVNTNVSSLAAQRNLSINQAQLGRSVERLSSGLRITRAADDAAGLGVSETLRAQIRSINQANRNAGDGISLTQVADGAAATVGSLLSRMRELATQSASGTLGATERSYLDQEFVALRSEIDRIATTTEYNGQPLLSGSSNTFEVFIGFKSGSGNSLNVALADLDVAAVGLTGASVSTAAAAQTMLSNIDSAISAVATARANYGSIQSRFEVAIQNLTVTAENFTAAESRIRDADIAQETSVFTKNQILTQSGIAILAQANSLPQQALALLRG